MVQPSKLENDIIEIKERNSRVEDDKAWETSWTRRIIIGVFTYFIIVLVFFLVGLPRPWLNAIVPVLAFVLSTFTLPVIKKVWVNRFRR